MKISILKSPAFQLLVFAGLVITGGFWCFSISSYDKATGSSLMLVLSICLICFGGIVAFISLMVALGAILDRCDSRNKDSTP